MFIVGVADDSMKMAPPRPPAPAVCVDGTEQLSNTTCCAGEEPPMVMRTFAFTLRARAPPLQVEEHCVKVVPVIVAVCDAEASVRLTTDPERVGG